MTRRDRSDPAIAAQAAERGAETALEHFGTDVAVETKRSKTDFVTAADTAAQRRIVDEIESHRPDDAIVAEEAPQPSTLPEQGRAWVIDPIDGTGNFMRGNPLWTTSVTLVEEDTPVASVNVMPATGDTYQADAEGFTVNGQPARVSDRTDAATFAIAGMMGWGPGGSSGVAAICDTLSERFGDLYRFRTGQTTLSMVAAGQLDGGVTFSAGASWDRIAGVHLVRQAGGVATDLQGDPWTMAASGLVVSNGQAHETLLEAVREIGERTDRARAD